MAEYVPTSEGWKEPVEDDRRPWRLVIEPRRQPSWPEAAWSELEELFPHQPGAYPGTWVDPDDEEAEDD